MSDLSDIKQRIFEENKIHDLLEAMECEHIKPKGNRYEAQLPKKFKSNNVRSVQVYENEHLPCRVRSKGLSRIDIFGLISYIVFDVYDENEQYRNLPKAKKWLCDQLGYTEYNNSHQKKTVTYDPLKWLKDIQKSREKKKINTYENEILDESILNQYVMYPNQFYLNEGIEYHTQLDFEVGFDVQTERIIFPIHNQYGDLISVKGRTIEPQYKSKGIYKFIYLYNFNKMIELYNWHRAIYHILERKEVIIFEAEKSCWLATQFDHPNCIAVSGDDLSDHQVKLLNRLPVDTKIILAMDKDKEVKEIVKQINKFNKSRLVYVMWDDNDLLSKDLKHSPVDLGSAVFEELYKNSFSHRAVK